MTLTLDPATHVYTWQGKPVRDSVTSVLRASGAMGEDVAHYTDASAAFGSAVHHYCRRYDEWDGDFDFDSIPDEYRPRVLAWKRWRERMDFRVVQIEEPLYNPVLQLAGTPDVVGYSIPSSEMIVVVDRKTGPIRPWHALQLAAYLHLADVSKRSRRIAVELRDTGEPNAVEFTDRHDWNVFLAKLTSVRWNREHTT